MRRLTLAELRVHNPKAYEKYVDLLVDSCEDEFVESDLGVLSAQLVCPTPEGNGTIFLWDETAQDGTWELLPTRKRV